MNWRDDLGRLLTLRCEEATRLASRERDEPLGRVDRLAMWGHLLACRSCRRFRGQIGRLGEVYRRSEGDPVVSDPGGEGLSADARRRIGEALGRTADDGQGEGDRG